MDLLASPTVRQVARDLFQAHEKEDFRLALQVKPGQDDSEGRVAAQAKIQELQSSLVEKVRADLGLGLPVPPRSLLGKILAYPYQ